MSNVSSNLLVISTYILVSHIRFIIIYHNFVCIVEAKLHGLCVCFASPCRLERDEASAVILAQASTQRSNWGIQERSTLPR